MPRVGFGTFRFKDGAAQRATSDALKAGYRLIDTAFCYGGEKTEGEVGKALRSSAAAVPREEVFLTTKHWRAYHGYEETKTCLDLSLKRLGLPSVREIQISSSKPPVDRLIYIYVCVYIYKPSQTSSKYFLTCRIWEQHSAELKHFLGSCWFCSYVVLGNQWRAEMKTG